MTKIIILLLFPLLAFSQYNLTGYVIDSDTHYPIENAKVVSYLGYMKVQTVYTDSTGQYFIVDKHPFEKIYATADGYNARWKKIIYFTEMNMYLLNRSKIRSRKRTQFYEPVDVPEINKEGRNMLKTDYIEFPLNESDLYLISEKLFIEISVIMKANEHINLFIEVHTDGRADKDYERQLSQDRADRIKDRLVYLEIDPNRIKAVGYGSDKPINGCVQDNEVKCSEKDWLINRRVNLVIIRL